MTSLSQRRGFTRCTTSQRSAKMKDNERPPWSLLDRQSANGAVPPCDLPQPPQRSVAETIPISISAELLGLYPLPSDWTSPAPDAVLPFGSSTSDQIRPPPCWVGDFHAPITGPFRAPTDTSMHIENPARFVAPTQFGATMPIWTQN